MRASSGVFAKHFAVHHSPQRTRLPVTVSPGVSIGIVKLSDVRTLSPHGAFSPEDFDQHRDSLRSIRESSVFHRQMMEPTHVARIAGQHGTGYVLLPSWVRIDLDQRPFFPPTNDTNTNETTTSDTSKNETSKNETDRRVLSVRWADEESFWQTRYAGFIRDKLANYAVHVSTPYSLPIRLNGVGFRAALEPISASQKSDVDLFEITVAHRASRVKKVYFRKIIAEQFRDSIWARVCMERQKFSHDTSLYFRQVYANSEPWTQQFMTENAKKESTLGQKLSLKLGYSHPIEIMVPPHIQVTVPKPDRIVLSGIDKQSIHEFATEIRNHRPPEPYKGKGVFVSDETIKLKEKRVK